MLSEVVRRISPEQTYTDIKPNNNQDNSKNVQFPIYKHLQLGTGRSGLDCFKESIQKLSIEVNFKHLMEEVNKLSAWNRPDADPNDIIIARLAKLARLSGVDIVILDRKTTSSIFFRFKTRRGRKRVFLLKEGNKYWGINPAQAECRL